MLIKLLKLQNKFYQTKLIVPAKFIKKIIRIIYSCDIPYTFNVPEGLHLAHSGLGVVIHGKSKIGKNVLIGHNCTIGGTPKAKHLPIIGDNCTIRAGSIIAGETIIGEHSIVAAGTTLVNKTFGPYMLIKGIQGESSKKRQDIKKRWH